MTTGTSALVHKVRLGGGPGSDRSESGHSGSVQSGSVQSGPLQSGRGHSGSSPPTIPTTPTVVMLHGQGGDERSMWVFARTIPREWLVVTPRGPEPEPGGGWSWRVAGPSNSDFDHGAPEPTSPDPFTGPPMKSEPSTDSGDGSGPPARPELGGAVRLPPISRFTPHIATLSEFVRSLPGAYGADPEATYLMGFSQGAAAAYCLALLRPGLTSAIAGLYGFVPEADDELFASHPLSGVRIWAASGEVDPYISPDTSLRAVDRLVAAGAEVEAHAYAGGHKLPRSGLRDLTSWWRTL